MKFVDCQNLGGSFSLGSVMAGFDMLHRVAAPGGFGNAIVDSNRHLLPGDWAIETSAPEDWTPQDDVSLITATPPCAGFSSLNTSKGVNARGADSTINSCMGDTIDYAARCYGSDGGRGPEIVTFESVPAAGRVGRALMQRLRDRMSYLTGQDYVLWHLFMSGASVGASQLRKRYFFLISRVPFGVYSPQVQAVCTYEDAIADLQGLKTDTWEPQLLQHPATWWSHSKRSGLPGTATPALHEVDSHTDGDYLNQRRFRQLAPYWEIGEPMRAAVRRYVDATGEKPWEGAREAWYNGDAGFGDSCRIRPNELGRVIGGWGGDAFCHYSEGRTLTVRECVRMMGFPDSWSYRAAKSVHQAFTVVGKQIPVESGYWVTNNVREALNGNPGTWQGTEIGENERLVNVSLDYKKVWHNRLRQRIDSRSKEQIAEMEARGS